MAFPVDVLWVEAQLSTQCSSTAQVPLCMMHGHRLVQLGLDGGIFFPTSRRLVRPTYICRCRRLIILQSETFNKPDAAYAAARNITWDDSYHGFSGPVQASHAPYDYPGSGKFKFSSYMQ